MDIVGKFNKNLIVSFGSVDGRNFSHPRRWKSVNFYWSVSFLVVWLGLQSKCGFWTASERMRHKLSKRELLVFLNFQHLKSMLCFLFRFPYRSRSGNSHSNGVTVGWVKQLPWPGKETGVDLSMARLLWKPDFLPLNLSQHINKWRSVHGERKPDPGPTSSARNQHDTNTWKYLAPPGVRRMEDLRNSRFIAGLWNEKFIAIHKRFPTAFAVTSRASKGHSNERSVSF